MTARERLHKGSFRGVPFFTPSSDLEGGRRGSVHEYPNSGVHTTQDNGRALRRFTVTAVVLGKDYDLAKARLIDALEQGGPGKLVHRYYGEFDAEIEPGQKFRVTENEQDGDKATFTIPFIRASRSALPTRTDTAQVVAKAADQVRTYARAKFYAEVDQFGPEWLRDQLLDTMNGINSTLRATNRTINGALGYTSGVKGAIDNFANAAATLIASPTLVFQLADNVLEINEAMFNAFATIGQAYKDTIAAFAGAPSLEAAQAKAEARKLVDLLGSTFAAITEMDDVALDETTELTEQSTRNQRSALMMTKASAAAETADSALALPFDARTTAEGLRDRLSELLAELALNADDDNLYQALLDLRVALSDHLTLLAGALPSPSYYTPRRAMNALLVAHLVHGDARRCDEIVVRNNIRHPGFCAPAVPIEVVDG